MYVMNSKQRLICAISDLGNINKSDAELVADLYIKEKHVKLDRVNGEFWTKHGAFLDSDVIGRALIEASK